MTRLGFLFSLTVSVSLLFFAGDLKAMAFDWARLEQGQVQTALETLPWAGAGENKRAVGAVIINASVDEVWQTLSCWDAMPEYVPNMVYCKTVYAADNRRWVANRLKLIGFEIDYSLEVNDDRSRGLQSWVMLEDEKIGALAGQGIKGLYPAHRGIKRITGDNRLSAYQGHRTLYLYAPVIETFIPVPYRLEQYLVKLTLPGYLLAVKQRVESGGRYRKNPE